ncbi:hypothetical protein KJ633_01290, partial [bacterium]|nr:hypothetical protein [bacterium]
MDFRQPYNQKEFTAFLGNFLPDDLAPAEEQINLSELSFKPEKIKKIKFLGNVKSLGDLRVYEIYHDSDLDPRVTLSRELFRLMSGYGVRKALAVFISKTSPDYRFSLATIDLELKGSRVAKEYSNPRRYSFFLGPDARTHTPYGYLIKQGQVKDADDLKHRFSIEVVNKEFYTEIAILFTKLAGGKRDVGRRKYDEKGCLKLPSTSNDTVRKEFAVRLIGRLVFCWFLKKKKSESGVSLIQEDVLSSEVVSNESGYYHKILEPLFFQALNTPVDKREKAFRITPWSQIPFLNGGLFSPHSHDYYEQGVMGISKNINTLKIPDGWFKDLFQIFETYNFTIDENTSMDVELSIDPEMLGRIFENLLAEISPETGESARKATGSYYTPRPIVEYMVDESLKQYLLTKTQLKNEIISSLLAYEAEAITLPDSQKEEILNALDSIKIIDPACGSGAFPMGVLQKILLILQKVDPDSKKWMEKKLSKIEDPFVKKSFMEKSENFNFIHKLGIIKDAIYGVDIQPIAVEVSKLRFFLSLIVDEIVDDNKKNRGVEPLPNLEFKFVCANSLIGLPKGERHQTSFFEERPEINEDARHDIEAWTNNKIKELKKIRDEYLLSYGNEKRKLEEKFKSIQAELFKSAIKSKSVATQSGALSTWKPFSDEKCEWFDPEWMFGTTDGFDIVIANPPYGFRKVLSAEEKQFFRKTMKIEFSTGDIA